METGLCFGRKRMRSPGGPGEEDAAKAQQRVVEGHAAERRPVLWTNPTSSCQTGWAATRRTGRPSTVQAGEIVGTGKRRGKRAGHLQGGALVDAVHRAAQLLAERLPLKGGRASAGAALPRERGVG